MGHWEEAFDELRKVKLERQGELEQVIYALKVSSKNLNTIHNEKIDIDSSLKRLKAKERRLLKIHKRSEEDEKEFKKIIMTKKQLKKRRRSLNRAERRENLVNQRLEVRKKDVRNSIISVERHYVDNLVESFGEENAIRILRSEYYYG